jgi:hypothetical protein
MRPRTGYIKVLGKVPIRDKPSFTVQITKFSSYIGLGTKNLIKQLINF